jgi:ubiquinone biosynthesis protein COQ9
MSDLVAERRAQRDRIFEAALLHAAFDGWTRRTLLNAAADAGVDAGAARRLFPRGGDGLLAWLDDWADRRMLAAVEGEDLARLPVRRRIARLVRARLEPLAPHREAMRRAALANGLPGNLATSTRALWRTVDLTWEAAGLGGSAAAEGFSYYSRRATLAAVVGTTFLYWLEDRSADSADTWAFLDRRIEDVMRVGKARAQIERWLGPFGGRSRPQASGAR